MLTVRHVLVSTLAARHPAFRTGTARAATTLKISHQFRRTIDRAISATALRVLPPKSQAQRGDIAAEVYPNLR